MREEYILAIVMLGLAALVLAFTKNDRKWWTPALLLASVAGSLAAGMGLRFREIVEGPFGFLDALLPVVMAALFLRMLKDNGAWDLLFDKLAGRSPLGASFGLLFYLALPGMLTGCASMCVLMSAVPVYDYLQKRNAPKSKAVSFIAAGSFLGMMLPPNCLPAIIAANGAGSVLPTPYVGFFLPLLVLSAPAFLLCGLLFAGLFKGVPAAAPAAEKKSSLLPLFPLGLVLLLVLIDGLLGSYLYIGGQTLVFLIGLVLAALLPAVKRNAKGILSSLTQGITDCALPVAAVFALGSFIEVSSMNGIRGVYSLLILPYSTTAVMLVLMALSLLVGFFFSAPLPAFFIAYAVFPIGWLANTVTVTGCAAAIGLAWLIACRGGLVSLVRDELSLPEVSYKETVPGLLLAGLPVLLMAVLLVVFGDSMTGLIL